MVLAELFQQSFHLQFKKISGIFDKRRHICLLKIEYLSYKPNFALKSTLHYIFTD